MYRYIKKRLSWKRSIFFVTSESETHILYRFITPWFKYFKPFYFLKCWWLWLTAEVLYSSPRPPYSDNQLVRSALHAWTVFWLTCSLHRVHCSLLPEQGKSIHSLICAAQRLHAQTSVTSYTSVNIYNFSSRLAHFNALWMEYIHSLQTGIMAEYPVMSTSQGTYVRIEQTSEAIRVTYEICRVGGARGLELRTAGLQIMKTQNSVSQKIRILHKIN